MGFNRVTIEVELLVSNHNSINDDLDYVKFKWLQRDIDAALKKYWGTMTDGGAPLVNQSTGERRWGMTVGDDRQGGYLLSSDSFNKGDE